MAAARRDAAGAGMAEAQRVLEKTFGYKAFRSHQRDIVASLVAGPTRWC